MPTKILTLRYAPSLGVFDDAPLLALSQLHEILALREHFFVYQDIPHLLCVITCHPRAHTQPRPPPAPPPTPPPREHGSSHTPANLSNEERALFDTLRRWRAETAEVAGVPRYVVLTNSNLEALIRTRPTTLTSLRKIRGIGKAKVEKYGEALLEMVRPPEDLPPLPTADESAPEEFEPS